MKITTLNTIITGMIICFLSCNEGSMAFAEQPKTVRAYAPEMNGMEMLSMTQQPGWALLAGTQWIGNAYCFSLKGVNDKLNANFFMDGNRNYSQSPMGRSGTSDGKTIYLNCMSAADYLDYVFRRQFPNVTGARRTMLKTLDRFPEEERRKLETLRMDLYNAMMQFYRQTPGGEYVTVRNVTADRAAAEYKWVQDGDTVVHCMDVSLTATYTDTNMPYLGRQSSILWNQNSLSTSTFPAKNRKQAEEDIEQMKASILPNEAYRAALNNIVMQEMQRTDADMRRVQSEMAQAEIRHQQRMSQMIRETNEYVMNVQRESFANSQASMERVSQGWRDAIVGVDRYMGTDGKVVEVPTSMGSHVWQSADGGTILTSDSYLFKPVDNLYDADGKVQEFRQLQLLK